MHHTTLKYFIIRSLSQMSNLSHWNKTTVLMNRTEQFQQIAYRDYAFWSGSEWYSSLHVVCWQIICGTLLVGGAYMKACVLGEMDSRLWIFECGAWMLFFCFTYFIRDRNVLSTFFSLSFLLVYLSVSYSISLSLSPSLSGCVCKHRRHCWNLKRHVGVLGVSASVWYRIFIRFIYISFFFF